MAPVNGSAVDHTVPLDEAGRVAVDLPCLGCGYNLRTMLPEGLCPECGTDVGRTLRGNLLPFADPRWVQTLSSGMNWIVAGLLVPLVLIALGLIWQVVMLQMSVRGHPVPGWVDDLYMCVLFVSVLGITLLVVTGVWRVTTPEPARAQAAKGATARPLARYGVLGCGGVAALDSLIEMLIGFDTLAHTTMWFWFFVQLAGVVLGGVGTAALLAHFTHLGQRVPDKSLAMHSRIVMWGAGLLMCAAVLVASGTLLPFRQHEPFFEFLELVLSGIGCVASLGAVVLGIWGLVVIVRYQRVFARLTREARANSQP
jgi:hypothetical protein